MSPPVPVMIVPLLAGAGRLAAMLATVAHPVDHLIVIDNGGLGPAISCDAARRVSVISVPANLGVAGAWNLGIKCSPFAEWWLVASHDVTWPPGSLAAFAARAGPGRLLLADAEPPWCAFAIGEQAVEAVGLFDERFFPAYCEDSDFARRAKSAGFPPEPSGVRVDHDNSSTIGDNPAWRDANARTHPANTALHAAKTAAGDNHPGLWSLARRREQAWENQ